MFPTEILGWVERPAQPNNTISAVYFIDEGTRRTLESRKSYFQKPGFSQKNPVSRSSVDR